MKKLFALAILLLFLPVSAHAHSGLTSSTPAEGESLSESPQEIRFQFDTPILQGDMTLTDESGNEVEIANISASDTELVGQLNDALPNGAYTVDWNVISQDSHEVSGTLAFNVAAEEAVEEEATEETIEEAAPEEETAQPADEQAEQDAASADEPAQESTSWVTIIIVAILAVTAITFFVLARRK
ncbi:copper resistance CopC family protein [Planococcus sp. CAU13]|uniref:copper resistance CopC family protein n=1 Tax=Planococcus sp. CAU13 TaxID=1541197 RepID=UPI00052FE2EA|nr:copper resistance CopC family protein [Planococcus sp. CAU13]